MGGSVYVAAAVGAVLSFPAAAFVLPGQARSSSLSGARAPFVTGAPPPSVGGGAPTTALSSAMSECLLTPEGYGFDSPLSRIVEGGGDRGYVSADKNDNIVDVMERIAGGEDGVDAENAKSGVALVFDREDGNRFVGIFTERDYVDFSMERTSTERSPEEAAKYLLAPVSQYVTRAEDVVSFSGEDIASSAVVSMRQNGIRHVLVADDVSPGYRLGDPRSILGVASMEDVMSQVQRDERLSLQKLVKKFPGLTDPLAQVREEQRSFANELAKEEGVGKTDLIRVLSVVLFVGGAATFLLQSSWLHDHALIGMVGIFVLGYAGIILEEVFEFNKAAVALLMSTALWITYADFFESTGKAGTTVLIELKEQLSEVSDICFFLLAASTIVEVVDAHQGFKVVTNAITTKSKLTLFWIIGFLTFFLSAILNNLTVTIVMVSLLKKLVPNIDDRRLFGAMVVVAANAGGVWTPIGDVTTTMLWINGNLSTLPTVTELFFPSFVCLVASLAWISRSVVEDDSLAESTLPEPSSLAPRGILVFTTGILCLLAVPVFSELTGLPPYLAMLTGLGAIWTLTDVIHMDDEESDGLKVPAALSKLDTSGILFFLGILMSIGVLDKAGLLKTLAVFLNDNLPSQEIIATVIGIASALIDNVPLVAATMGMYDLSEFGTDDRLWQLIALCAGTGGSIFIIGSASGVALMGLEKVDFIWYAKNISAGAAVGYFGGIAAYLAQTQLVSMLAPPALLVADVVSQGGALPM